VTKKSPVAFALQKTHALKGYCLKPRKIITGGLGIGFGFGLCNLIILVNKKYLYVFY